MISRQGLAREVAARCVEARAEFQRAASLTQNGRERRLLLDRAAGCDAAGGG